MRIVVAPDKFKGSCSAGAVAAAIVDGIRAVWSDAATFDCIPLADGGDGTVAAFVEDGAQPQTVTVRGPLGAPVPATYARDGTCAILEMAAASGLVAPSR